MTRRAEAEIMLRRYGEPVSLGNDTFPAILRPLRFSSQEDTEDGGTDCLYTGPAAYKPAVGDTVSARGRTYRTVRSETVALGGEELYVRAVLALLPAGADEAVRIERGGAVLAAAESYDVRARQASGAEIQWGGSGPDEISAGAVTFVLTLRNVVPEDGADLFGTDGFDVAMTRGGTKTVYSGCRWKIVKNTGGLAGRPLFELEVLAAKRTVSGREAQTNG